MGLRFHHKIDMKAGFHLIRIALGHKKLTAFRYKFGLYEYIVMPFGLTNVPATFQYEINEMLWPYVGLKLDIHTKLDLNMDGGMVVVANIDDVLITITGCIKKHHE